MGLTETHLDAAVETVSLEGYELVARRDRDNRGGGAVAVFALTSVAKRVTHLESSESSERVWVAVHTEQGPFAVAVWYRPPSRVEVESVNTLVTEVQQWREQTLGTVVLGDMNVHNLEWLRHSSHTSAAGRELRQTCRELGFRQLVREPTHVAGNLLDLVLTDIDNVSVVVHPRVADHNVVEAQLKLAVPKFKALRRQVWNWQSADWAGLRDDF